MERIMSDTTYGTGDTGGAGGAGGAGGGAADDHSDALSALEQLHSEVGGAEGAAADFSAAGMDPAQLCDQYRRIKPLLQTALKLVKAIPVYGPRIASAIQFLMQIADTVCPPATA